MCSCVCTMLAHVYAILPLLVVCSSNAADTLHSTKPQRRRVYTHSTSIPVMMFPFHRFALLLLCCAAKFPADISVSISGYHKRQTREAAEGIHDRRRGRGKG